MKLKDPNPLNFYKARQVDFLPAHFEVVITPMTYNLSESIVSWIQRNLKGRFYVGKAIDISSNQLENVIKIGFEDPKEASYFSLACPHLKYR